MRWKTNFPPRALVLRSSTGISSACLMIIRILLAGFPLRSLVPDFASIRTAAQCQSVMAPPAASWTSDSAVRTILAIADSGCIARDGLLGCVVGFLMDINVTPRSGVMTAPAMRPNPSTVRDITLAEHYRSVRRFTESLCEPLAPDDFVIQSMTDASPIKWHLAHTTWFFETFVLARSIPGYRPFHSLFNFLFNSYYDAAGPRWPRPQRGLLSRPTVTEI